MIYPDDWPPDVFGPYEDEGYTGLPVEKPGGEAGTTHHGECTWMEGESSEHCQCKELWRRDYEIRKDIEAEDLHRYYQGGECL